MLSQRLPSCNLRVKSIDLPPGVSSTRPIERVADASRSRSLLRRGRPEIVPWRSLLVHAAAGASCGWGVLAGLLLTDSAGLATLLENAQEGTLALLLLFLQFGAGFATFAVAGAVALSGAGKPT